MVIEFAPMEGISVYPFRMAHKSLYGGIDRYYLPFVEAHQTKTLKKKEMKDLLPEHNPGGCCVPQLMAKHADLALCYIEMVEEYGFSEINLNFGCPSGTVIAKGKGAGALEDPEGMDRFFDELFHGLDTKNSEVRISVKSRIGMTSCDKMEDLISVYNRYPFSEIIVHPRLGKDAYKGTVNLEAFDEFYENLRIPVSYNGDLRTAEDVRSVSSRYPRLHAVMIGRGLLADPALGERISGPVSEGAHADRQEEAAIPAPLQDPRLLHFLETLEEAWMEDLHDSVSVLFRLKEYWTYLAWNFEDSLTVQKKIRKARSLSEYHAAVRKLLTSAPCDISTDL